MHGDKQEMKSKRSGGGRGDCGVPGRKAMALGEGNGGASHSTGSKLGLEERFRVEAYVLEIQREEGVCRCGEQGENRKGKERVCTGLPDKNRKSSGEMSRAQQG